VPDHLHRPPARCHVQAKARHIHTKQSVNTKLQPVRVIHGMTCRCLDEVRRLVRSLYVVQTMELFARQQLAGLGTGCMGHLQCRAGDEPLCTEADNRRGPVRYVGESGHAAGYALALLYCSLNMACCESCYLRTAHFLRHPWLVMHVLGHYHTRPPHSSAAACDGRVVDHISLNSPAAIAPWSSRRAMTTQSDQSTPSEHAASPCDVWFAVDVLC
jgi:hypothetical protein